MLQFQEIGKVTSELVPNLRAKKLIRTTINLGELRLNLQEKVIVLVINVDLGLKFLDSPEPLSCQEPLKNEWQITTCQGRGAAGDRRSSVGFD